MKVCFVGLANLPVLAREFGEHPIGGAELQMTLIGRALALRGHEVSMVVHDYGQPDGAAWDGIRTFRAYGRDDGLPVVRFVHPRWTSVWSAMRRADADVYVTSCAGMAVGLCAMFCRANRRGFVFRLANDTDVQPEHAYRLPYARDRWLYRYGLRRADAVLSQNTYQQRRLADDFGISSVPIRSLVEQPQQILGFDARDADVLWVANIRDQKRPGLMLELARGLPGRRIHMAGGAVSGQRELFDRIRASAVAIRGLEFHGQVSYHRIGDLFDRARVFVNTSSAEGFPNTFLQAWVRGIPVVSLLDPDGLIASEGLGAVADDVAGLRRAVERLLDDPAAWQAASQRCLAYIRRARDEDTLLAPYLQALETAALKAQRGAAASSGGGMSTSAGE